MKKILVLLLIICLFGCKSNETYEKYYYSYFDTVSLVKSYSSDDEKTFNQKADKIEAILNKYHNLLDTFEDHDVDGLYKINKLAGKESVAVCEELFDLLKFGKEIYYVTNGKTNIMMGSLTKIWKSAISEEKLPDNTTLQEAAKHISIDSLVLNEDDLSIYISDEHSLIDVGSIAKGYVCDVIKKELGDELDGYSISLGGNILLIGSKYNGSDFKIAIKDPLKGNSLAKTLSVNNTSLVTSGNYERYFDLDGVRYHHIIDPDTLYPSRYYASVTVVYEESKICDALSTALFSLSIENGKKILENYPGISVTWIDLDNNIVDY